MEQIGEASNYSAGCGVVENGKRIGSSPERQLKVSGDAVMSFVLVPEGESTLGAPDPESLGFGVALLVIAGGGAIFLLRRIRRHSRFQFSLLALIALALLLAVAQYGVWICWQAKRDKANLSNWDGPMRSYRATQSFYLGKYEVTQEQYEAVMHENPSRFKGSNMPVEVVSWEAAMEFCSRLSEQTGECVRLPTSDEWEYACRAGSTTNFCSGETDDDLDSVGWYRRNSEKVPHPVGQKKPNAWGLYDMHGNVWEWCADGFGEGSPSNPEFRILRGGCYVSIPIYCRSSAINGFPAKEKAFYNGFRVLMTRTKPTTTSGK